MLVPCVLAFGAEGREIAAGARTLFVNGATDPGADVSLKRCASGQFPRAAVHRSKKRRDRDGHLLRDAAFRMGVRFGPIE